MGLVMAAVALVSVVPASSAVPADRAQPVLGSIRYTGHPDAIPGSFVVVLKDTVLNDAAPKDGASTAQALAARYGLSVRHTYTAALAGMAVQDATERQARLLAADPQVDYVAQDLKVSVAAPGTLDCTLPPCVRVQLLGLPPPSWHHLDRIDQRSRPLDGKYHYTNTAQDVRAYVIDTGLRFTHQEYQGRAVSGTDVVGGVSPPGSDCNGHGTHVGATIGGATVGVAKQVTLVAVRVFNCAGSGSYSAVIAGVDWVTYDRIATQRPGVANLSASGSLFQPLNTAVTNSIAAGVHYSVPAGNNNGDACVFSPGSTPRATTVAASDTTDAKASFSNYGTCVDLYAPGASVYSAWATSDSAYNTMSGTSMATALATGIAALWRQRFPSDNADQVAMALAANATPNVITGNPPGTVNLLVFSGMIPA